MIYLVRAKKQCGTSLHRPLVLLSYVVLLKICYRKTEIEISISIIQYLISTIYAVVFFLFKKPATIAVINAPKIRYPKILIEILIVRNIFFCNISCSLISCGK